MAAAAVTADLGRPSSCSSFSIILEIRVSGYTKLAGRERLEMNGGNIRFWDLCGGGNGGCFLVLTVETESGAKIDAFTSKFGSFCGKFEENWGIGGV